MGIIRQLHGRARYLANEIVETYGELEWLTMGKIKQTPPSRVFSLKTQRLRH